MTSQGKKYATARGYAKATLSLADVIPAHYGVLNALIRKADGWSLLEPLDTWLPDRASFYADDLVMFISPTAQDLQLTHSILSSKKRLG
jgi:hypothetical protein